MKLTCMICCCRACSRYMEGTLADASSGRRDATNELLHGDAEFISNTKQPTRRSLSTLDHSTSTKLGFN